MMTHRSLGPLALCAALAAACNQGEPTAPVLEQRVVVHAVLDPQSAEQVVLVERTQGGTAGATPTTSDPIVSSGGVPISGARVVLYGPGTDSVVAVEDRTQRSDGSGSGVYRVPSRAVGSRTAAAAPGVLRLAPGARYRLRVETPLGTVTGSTRVPRFNLTINRTPREFNLDTDSLRRPSVPGEGGSPAGYLLRHQMTGIVNRERLLGDTTVTLLAPAPATDDRTWSFAFSRRNIRPGVAQRFIVAAVDSNFYEYSVGGYDPFGHDARGNRLEGGVGLFGAVATVVDAHLNLIANRDHPIEGEWSPTVVNLSLPASLRLYESPRFPGPSGSTGLHLWGTATMPGGQTYIVDASQVGDVLQLTLTVPGSQQVKRLTGHFDGTELVLDVAGTALRIRYRNGA